MIYFIFISKLSEKRRPILSAILETFFQISSLQFSKLQHTIGWMMKFSKVLLRLKEVIEKNSGHNEIHFSISIEDFYLFIEDS
jgi:hypothetical protein